MSEIRLIFAGLPQMLSEILRNAAASTSDLKVVDERAALAQLAEAARQVHPDVMVVGSKDGGLPRECIRIMYESPHSGTISIAEDGSLTTSFRLLPHGVAMENVSAGDIVEAIRELSRNAPGTRV